MHFYPTCSCIYVERPMPYHAMLSFGEGEIEKRKKLLHCSCLCVSQGNGCFYADMQSSLPRMPPKPPRSTKNPYMALGGPVSQVLITLDERSDGGGFLVGTAPQFCKELSPT